MAIGLARNLQSLGLSMPLEWIPKEIQDVHNYWRSPRGQYEFGALISSFPILGSLMKHRDAMAEMDEALSRYGWDWDDIKYPTKTLGYTFNGNLYGGMNWASSNIGKLYK